MEPDADMVERRRGADERRITVTRGLRDGERVGISGTSVEVFAVQGHTPGSAAFLVNGVLFLGDSAAALSDGTLKPNTMLSDNADQTVRSLTVEGLDPLLKWVNSAK